MSSSKLIQIFVYGTLKSGEPNHHWLTNSTNGSANFLSFGKTVDLFPLIIGTRYNIPMLLNKKGIGNYIDGEIYEVDDEMFDKLDQLEQYPDYYDREIQDIMTENGIISCWMYLVKNYSEAMLANEMITSYSNSKEHPYCERYCSDFEKATYF